MKPVAHGLFHDRLGHSRYYRAFRTSGGNPAHAIDIGAPDTLQEAVNAAKLAGGFAHKDTLLIHEVDEGKRKAVLHSYAIVKKAAVWMRLPGESVSKRVEPLEPSHLFSVPVDAFKPTRAFDAFKDNAVGVDRTLVSQ